MQRRWVTVVLALLTVVLAVPTVVRLVGDGGRSLLVLAAVVTPLLVPVLLVWAVGLVLARQRVLAGATAVLLALNVVWLAPLYVGDDVHDGEPLTVLTANLRFGEADPFALVRLLQQQHVDVLATQELTPEEVILLRGAGLEQVLPYARLEARYGPDGCGLWSRYPITELPSFTARFQAPGAVVHAPGGDVVVRVLHPTRATLTAAGAYRRDYAGLTAQVRALDRAVPTILAGDFNASTDNTVLRRLMGDRFRDASEVAGSGLQRTWAPGDRWLALLHLDHVLVDSRFDVRATKVLDVRGSDHEGVLAQLILR